MKKEDEKTYQYDRGPLYPLRAVLVDGVPKPISIEEFDERMRLLREKFAKKK